MSNKSDEPLLSLPAKVLCSLEDRCILREVEDNMEHTDPFEPSSDVRFPREEVVEDADGVRFIKVRAGCPPNFV